MFCKRCGAFVEDDSQFCTHCGTATAPTPVVAQAFTQPVLRPQPVVQPKQVQQPKSVASAPKPKKNGLLCTITFILTMLLLVASVLAPLYKSVLEIPIISVFAGDDLEDVIEELEDEWEDSEDYMETLEDRLSGKDKRAVKDLGKAIEKTLDNPSLMNFNATLKAAEETDVTYKGQWRNDLDELEQILLLALIGSVAVFLPSLLLALIAGLKKSPILTVVAMILTLLAQLMLTGFLLAGLSLAVNILQIVAQKKYQS